jgi:predicted dehydrogenase
MRKLSVRQKASDWSAFCVSNPSSAQSFGASWGVPAFDSLEAMLQNLEINSVHVLVRPKITLRAGVHVFIEKPMCSSVEQADELLELARNSGLHIGVNHDMVCWTLSAASQGRAFGDSVRSIT